MSDKNDKIEGRVMPANKGLAVSIIMSMADTTWRMFTPPAIFVSAGLFADIKFATKPWLTILGALIGLGLAVLLVRAQLRGGI